MTLAAACGGSHDAAKDQEIRDLKATIAAQSQAPAKQPAQQSTTERQVQPVKPVAQPSAFKPSGPTKVVGKFSGGPYYVTVTGISTPQVITYMNSKSTLNHGYFVVVNFEMSPHADAVDQVTASLKEYTLVVPTGKQYAVDPIESDKYNLTVHGDRASYVRLQPKGNKKQISAVFKVPNRDGEYGFEYAAGYTANLGELPATGKVLTLPEE
jgi:hypothetical protein